MGLFSSKKKLTVEKKHVTVIQHKIIKFSYLQTLAVTGGLSNIKDVAGETKSTEEGGEIESSKKNSGSKLAGLGFILGGPVGGIIGSLFGKSVRREVTETVKDSGWKVTKSWLQPEFDKIRYALGIRELLVARFTYELVSEVVSTPWISPKDISKVTILADEFIPKEFPAGGIYIEYYIRPELDQEFDWVRINPIGGRTVFDDTGTIVPRIVNFNNEKPVGSRLEESFIDTESDVKQIRFKAVIRRPTSIGDLDGDSYTPILKSYRIMLHPRAGL